jgi:predicted alpha/beta superfamily hydrolase
MVIAYVITSVLSVTFIDQVRGEQDIIIGKRVSIRSQILNENRELLIYLPQDYEQSNDKYPVIYLLDGNDHFHHVSGIVQFSTWARKRKGQIIVALTNTRRGRDFSPSNWPGYDSYTGGADAFINFMEKELIPYVDMAFRTQPQKVLAGHSLAGTFTLYSFLTKPELFNAYISLSPCLFWHDRLMLKKTASFLEKHKKLDRTLFIAHEYKDGSPAATIQEFENSFNKNAPQNLRWVSLLKDKDDHFSFVHTAFYDALEFIFD